MLVPSLWPPVGSSLLGPPEGALIGWPVSGGGTEEDGPLMTLVAVDHPPHQGLPASGFLFHLIINFLSSVCVFFDSMETVQVILVDSH